MSWQMTAAVKTFLEHCRIKKVRARHAALLYPMADECRPGQTRCWPSYKRIAAASRMSRSSVIRLLRELSKLKGKGYERGLVVILSRRRRGCKKRSSNVYELADLVALGAAWKEKADAGKIPEIDDDPYEDDPFGDDTDEGLVPK